MRRQWSHPIPVGSARARTAALIALCTLRPITHVVPFGQTGLWLARTLVRQSMLVVSRPLAGTTVEVSRSGPVAGEWVSGPAVAPSPAAIFYIHGSAYALCSARTHRGLASRLSAATGMRVFSCDYRLAPEHVFPAAADDVLAAYRWFLEQGVDPQCVVVAGDSAGGHLAIDLIAECVRLGVPQPAAMVLFSPLIDLTLSLAAQQEIRRRDPMISAKRARELVSLYTVGQPDDHPRLRLTPTAQQQFPPCLIQAGGAEMLSADARHLAAMLEAAGVDCELQIWPDQMHVFQAISMLPEAHTAVAEVAAFVDRALRLRTHPSAEATSA